MTLYPKRLLIVSQYFYPEYFKISEMAEYLAAKGYEVEVLASIPNYPEGVYTKGYGLFKKRIEKYRGMKIYRAFQLTRGRKAKAWKLALGYFSYLVAASVWAIGFAIFKRKYDAVICFQTTPVTQTFPGLLYGKLRGVPVISWILDIWPDSVLGRYNTSKSVIKKPLEKLTEVMYRRSSRLLISSPMFKELVCRNQDYTSKIEYFPNWCEDLQQQPLRSDIPVLPSGFKIMLAGNIGAEQDPETIGKAILELRNKKDIKWIFVGGGSRLQWLQDFVRDNRLEEVVFILGRFPFEAMHSLYQQADAMLLTLKSTNQPHLDATVPARVQSYLSAGKPILGMIGKGAGQIIEEAGAGIVVPPGDYQGLIKAVTQLRGDESLQKRMGEAGRKYYLQNFTPLGCMNHLEKILRSL